MLRTDKYVQIRTTTLPLHFISAHNLRAVIYFERNLERNQGLTAPFTYGYKTSIYEPHWRNSASK